jgi:LmbE family N-acetylglucosaminyl deacetylase
MLPLNLRARSGTPLRILCFGAHSDDLEIGCGGLILSTLASGADVDVEWVVLSADTVREREAHCSARSFLQGARRAHVTVRQFTDGCFPFEGAAIKEEFERLKHTLPAPDLVLTHYRDDRHQDHRLISDLTWNTFRDQLVLEYEIPKYDGDLGAPNTFVPLDRATSRRKAEYIERAFASQRDKHWFTSDTFLGLMRLRGIECRALEGYAEGFYARKLVLGF